jgi:hypothetical protein
MRGSGEKLTRKQEVAIAALLTAPTIADAAHTGQHLRANLVALAPT